ncbi:flagellar hook-associated protein FlgK [Azovibrio restrictus]|uniref:flagellar hook-associated protein FlgK n=1 Tax=Azovibrio restrictus TaxID=146938 RepID=UPI000405D4D8|nr:flagellar hook-associated protein FlgK [Azovibrio restrictus]
MSLLNTGVTAIATAQLGLATTQHNIANANTAGYSRQSIMQATNIAMVTGAGSIGQGVHVSTIVRSYSAVLQSQVNSAQSKSSELDTYYGMISRIDNLLADSSSGMSPVLAGFFQGVQDVATNPSLVSARQSMVSSAQALVTRFQTLENRLSQLYEETNTQVKDTVGLINTYSSQIANLNEKIVALSTTGNTPNDLLDQRDQMVLELNKLVRVSTVQDSQGAYNVFAGNGQQLVVGNQVVPLEVRPSASDPERYVVAQQGSAAELPDSYLDGGSLGGFLSFRTEALDQAANALGQMAASLALTVNAQQALGQDLLGNVSGDAAFVSEFFKIGSPKSVENSMNTGTGGVASFEFQDPQVSSSGNYYTQITTSDYEVRFAAGGSFEITRVNDGAVVATGTEGTAVNFDGLTLDFSAGHAAGDTYLLQPTREIARNITVNQEISGDVRKIAAAAPIRTAAATGNVGTATITAGSVVGSPYQIPALSLEYVAGTNSLRGFAPGTTVNVDGTNYAIAAATDEIPYTSGATITIDNFAFSISGTPAGGDRFLVEANTGGTADARNIVKIGALQTAQTMNGDGTKGVSTFQVSYAQLVSDIGTKTKTALVNGTAQATVLEQAVAARDAVSGVNLDEEAANLIKYQQAYQAAARMMDTVSKLFDTLLSIGA